MISGSFFSNETFVFKSEFEIDLLPVGETNLALKGGGGFEVITFFMEEGSDTLFSIILFERGLLDKKETVNCKPRLKIRLHLLCVPSDNDLS